MGRLRDCCTAWLALPAAWVALAALLVMGSTLGVAQLCFGLLMLVASPLLRRGFLAVVRHIYPTRFGRAHVWFMLFVRRYYLGGRRHAAPIRVELRASQARSPRWRAPPSRRGSTSGPSGSGSTLRWPACPPRARPSSPRCPSASGSTTRSSTTTCRCCAARGPSRRTAAPDLRRAHYAGRALARPMLTYLYIKCFVEHSTGASSS